MGGREPAHFECELTPCELRELRRECKYYGLDDLMFPPPESPVVFSFKATLFKSGAGDTFVVASEKRECVEVDARAAKKKKASLDVASQRPTPPATEGSERRSLAQRRSSGKDMSKPSRGT